MSQLTDLNIAEARDGLSKGDFTSTELTQAYIKSMEAFRSLNAYITETPEIALERAKDSDARRASGSAASPMGGVPIVLTTAASHILDGFKPTYESTVTANLRAGGAVMLGKTNLDEFAMGSANMTSYYGAVKNPWKGPGDKELVPGGSSGGSASAV
ncbi:MAG: amidase family protein, partial [Rhodospirillales bacterium]